MAKPTIMDAWGNPMKARAATDQPAFAHAAAERFSQEMASWLPSLRSADSEWLPERNTVAARVHDIARNDGWTSGAMQRYVDQAIGAAFRLSYRPMWQALGLSVDWAREFSREVEARFWMWANDPRCYCDAGERNSLAGLLGLGFRHRMIDGETLALAQWLPGRAPSVYATAIQMIDPDRLSTPAGRIDDDRLRAGVEMNRNGAPLAYHIRSVHPGEMYTTGAQMMIWVRIERRTRWGRLRVLHFFEQERAGQTRGKSILTPILERLKMEHRYSRIELQAALVNAIFGAFIESPFDSSLIEEGLDVVQPYQDARAEFHADRRITLDGVRIPHLFPGERLNFAAANRPNSNYADFEAAALRYFAAGIGQSYEQLAQDWSKTNYSSARAAMLESWKFLTARREAYAAAIATPIFALWLEEAIDRGDIQLPPEAPDFWTGFPAWTRCRWIGPGRGWVDPVKEAQAAKIRKEALLSTLQDEAAEQGRDWEETLEQLAFEKARCEELGLPEPAAVKVVEAPGGGDRSDERKRDEET